MFVSIQQIPEDVLISGNFLPATTQWSIFTGEPHDLGIEVLQHWIAVNYLPIIETM